MKNTMLLLAALMLAQCAIAQKVKVKKGDILLDKVKIGGIEKVKTETPKYYQISDAAGTPLLKIKTVSLESPIFHADHVYDYHIVTGDKITDTLAIDPKGFYLTQKRVAEYVIEQGFLDANGFNAEKTAELVQNSKKMPEEIDRSIQFDQELLAQIAYREPRQYTTEPVIFLEPYSPILDQSVMLDRKVKSTKFDIFQDVEGDHILIGYGIFEFSEILNAVSYEKIFILNARKVPLASYGDLTYRRYVNDITMGLADHDLNELKSRDAIIKTMAIDLVKRKQL